MKELLEGLKYEHVEVVKSRRGDYDVSVEEGRKKILFEVKVATQDINKSFQFNGVRYGQKIHTFILFWQFYQILLST